MSLPELTSAEHKIAASECDAIAEYFEKLADLHDGPLGEYLALQHRTDAFGVRARADRHRQLAGE